jgi:cyanophycin synthetase
MANRCKEIIITLLSLLGTEIGTGKVIEMTADRHRIIFSYEYKETSIKTALLAVNIINSLISKSSINLDTIVNELKTIMLDEIIGPSTGAICEEAKKLGVPVLKLGDTGMFQLGLGKYGKLIDATICEDTSAVGVDISCNKMLTKKVLMLHALPVAKGSIVKSLEGLLYQVREIGYPVVLKPLNGNQGKGVIVNIRNDNEVITAFNKLKKLYNSLIIEKYIQGMDYRVCVIDGKVEAVSLRLPPFVIGDGQQTIEELIKTLNLDPRRGEDHEKPLSKVKIDDELIRCIEKSGFNLKSVLSDGTKQYLRENANISTGGVAIDCTDNICVENIEICIRAAKALSLNICGIDICCKDISIPISEEGSIIEVNSAPGIRMHHYPYVGKSRNVGRAIVQMMFKNSPKTIPIISVTGTNGKTTVARLICHVLSSMDYKVGMTTTGGIYISGRCIEKGDTTGFKSALTVLYNKEIDAAVLETARGGIIRNGLAYDLADIGIITNITNDHLGIDGINTIEELSFVKALVGEAVKEHGYTVMNADDEVSMNILKRIKSKIILFSRYKNNSYVRSNVDKGGIGVYSFEGSLWVEKGNELFKIMDIKDIRITLQGRLTYNIENSLAACSALVGLGIDYSIIARGLTTFESNEEYNPGRFNMYDINGRTVILDYGHNIEAYRSVIEGIKAINHTRIVGVIGVPGDRINSSILEIGKFSGDHFDYIYIKEDYEKRGREVGEVAEILQKGAYLSGIDRGNVEIILDEKAAFLKALENSKNGDLIIIFFEKYEPLLKIIKEAQP